MVGLEVRLTGNKGYSRVAIIRTIDYPEWLREHVSLYVYMVMCTVCSVLAGVSAKVCFRILTRLQKLLDICTKFWLIVHHVCSTSEKEECCVEYRQ